MKEKTVEEILKQKYISAKDLKTIIPELGINKAREYIEEIQDVMKEKNYYIPPCRTKLALTKLIVKKMGI